MAKIKVVDQAVVITSSLTNKELTRAQKYFPEALILKEKNEDGKLVPVFAIEPAEIPYVGKSGIVFPVTKGTSEEYASVTVTIPKQSKTARTEYVKDNYGKVLMNLNKLESAYKAQADAFDKEYAEISKNIDVE